MLTHAVTQDGTPTGCGMQSSSSVHAPALRLMPLLLHQPLVALLAPWHACATPLFAARCHGSILGRAEMADDQMT